MPNGTTLDWARTTQEQAEKKALALAERVGGAFLHATVDGRYNPGTPEWWTSGFWPGMLWLLYQRTQDERLADQARAAEDALARMFDDERFLHLHHDVGFQFLPTAVMRYKLTGDAEARRRGLLAAAYLASRYNLAAGVIEAWNGENNRGKSIIDTMMNLPLLYWASEETGLSRFRQIADAHARAAIRHFVRADGSTHHIIRFDPDTGARVEAIGGQGYAPDSTWSRGQAWALCGFAVAHRLTQTAEYLAVARLIADSFLANLPEEGVPPWDFRAPDVATAPRDSSAGAIAAAGLYELGRLLPFGQGAAYEAGAHRLMQALNERCATWDMPSEDGLLRLATGNLPGGRDIEVSIIYGDYYFLETLGKLNGNIITTW